MVNLHLHAEHLHTSFTASPCGQLLGDPQVLPQVLSTELQGDSVNSPSCSSPVHASMGTPYTTIAYIEYLHIVQNISLVFMLLSYSEYYITPHFIEGTNFEKLSHLHSKVYIVKWIIQGSNPGQSD